MCMCKCGAVEQLLPILRNGHTNICWFYQLSKDIKQSIEFNDRFCGCLPSLKSFKFKLMNKTNLNITLSVSPFLGKGWTVSGHRPIFQFQKHCNALWQWYCTLIPSQLSSQAVFLMPHTCDDICHSLYSATLYVTSGVIHQLEIPLPFAFIINCFIFLTPNTALSPAYSPSWYMTGFICSL